MEQSPNKNLDSDEISLKQIIINISKFKAYVFLNWKLLIALTVSGAILGGLYSFFSHKVYVAEANFVFEESEGSEPSGLSLLGMGAEQASLFQGDNLIWLYKSKVMLSETLLATVTNGDKKILLINWLIKIDPKVKEKAEEILEAGQKIAFNEGAQIKGLSLFENKLLSYAVNIIRNDYLEVETVNKTMGVISVKVKSEDELFAKSFADRIVSSVNSFYIQTKTKKTAEQVEVLEKKVTEFNSIMNKSMQQVATSLDNTPYANPSRQSLKVSSQYKSVDVQVSSGMYSQMMQQLEMAKIALAKETPLIQVVDAPILPLPSEKPGLVKFIVIFAILFFMLTVVWLFVKWSYVKIMYDNTNLNY